MSYEIVDGKAIDENGNAKVVHEREGYLYFYVDKPGKDMFDVYGKDIVDVLQRVKDDDADEIIVNKLFGVSYSPIRYLDREYGKQRRETTLAEVKDSKETYCVGYATSSGFSSHTHLMGHKVLETTALGKAMKYASSEEAETMIETFKESIKKERMEYYEVSDNYGSGDENMRFVEEDMSRKKFKVFQYLVYPHMWLNTKDIYFIANRYFEEETDSRLASPIRRFKTMDWLTGLYEYINLEFVDDRGRIMVKYGDTRKPLNDDFILEYTLSDNSREFILNYLKRHN